MGGTYANTVSITGGDFPIRRNVNRLPAISNRRAIVDFATMKRHVQVGAIELKGRGERGAGRYTSDQERGCVQCTSAQQQAYEYIAVQVLFPPLERLEEADVNP